MAVVDPCLIRSVDVSGQPVLRLGVPQLDAYLDFVAGRCRPNTVLATAYDLKIFFAVVGKDPAEVSSADVLGFITAQRHGGDGRLQLADGGGGVAARSVQRRLSSVSGLFAYLHARGDVAVNPVPRGLPTRRERQRPRQGVPLVRSTRTLPRVLMPGEVDALLAALRRQRDRAIVLGGLRLRGPRIAFGTLPPAGRGDSPRGRRREADPRGRGTSGRTQRRPVGGRRATPRGPRPTAGEHLPCLSFRIGHHHPAGLALADVDSSRPRGSRDGRPPLADHR